MSAIATIHRPPGKAWYFLQLAPVRIVVAALSVAGIVAAVQLCARAAHIKAKSGPGMIFGVLLVFVMGAAYSSYARLVERRKVVELTRSGAFTEFAWGLLAGAALFAVTASILGLLGAEAAGVGGAEHQQAKGFRRGAHAQRQHCHRFFGGGVSSQRGCKAGDGVDGNLDDRDRNA